MVMFAMMATLRTEADHYAWSLVAPLRLRLRNGAVISRQALRGKLWYILQDATSGRNYRFSPEAYLIVASLNGIRTMAEIRDRARQRLGEDAPTDDEIIRLLQQLHAADALR